MHKTSPREQLVVVCGKRNFPKLAPGRRDICSVLECEAFHGRVEKLDRAGMNRTSESARSSGAQSVRLRTCTLRNPRPINNSVYPDGSLTEREEKANRTNILLQSVHNLTSCVIIFVRSSLSRRTTSCEAGRGAAAA